MNMRRYISMLWHGSGLSTHFLFKKTPLATAKSTATTAVALLLVLVLFVAAFVISLSVNSSVFNPGGGGSSREILPIKHSHIIPEHSRRIHKPRTQYSLHCSAQWNLTSDCSAASQLLVNDADDEGDEAGTTTTCPEYYRWIHEDLRPWRQTGITREMVDRAKRTANFRLVIVKGRAYVERYERSFQTRDVFTIWGIMQLLRRYPGKLPDLDLMFDCVDWPVVKASQYSQRSGPNATGPPPLFRYCGDDETLDIVFPDWSFWGWPEINIEPWEILSGKLKRGNKKMSWTDREPYAYWKGNPAVAATRQDLLKCNVSKEYDWNARLYAQDWLGESRKGYKESNLADQCIHRYKIYIEGSAWSVSEKYILACDSLTLVVKPRYYDFFTRSLVPVKHYWPIKKDDKCRSIKFAVDWGNRHKKKVQEIGREASEFVQESLKMEYVYDYMFHLLNEYAKLLRYKPTRPRKAIELCPEKMACPAKGLEKKFMMESMVNSPSDRKPCVMPPAPTPQDVQGLLKRNANLIKQVETWEEQYWHNQAKQF